MKLPEREKAAHRAAFRKMSAAEKLDHIATYYKWPILLALIALIVLGSVLHRQLTYREPALYLALVNVSVGEDMEKALTEEYLAQRDPGAAGRAVYLYRDLYLSDDADVLNHEYAYASRMKVMGAIQSQKLDVAVMNREGYDLFSSNGFLLELPELLAADPALEQALAPYLTQNSVVLSDNGIEYQLGEAETHDVVTEEAANALSAGVWPRFSDAGFSGEVYVGVLANSPRTDEAIRYLHYLADAAG
ncbi:MAG: hypothetical protein IJS79_05970 [Oscillospiraceae bacterium]|nr:hypothetical protein [Oscillospiraceae bacterium]